MNRVQQGRIRATGPNLRQVVHESCDGLIHLGFGCHFDISSCHLRFLLNKRHPSGIHQSALIFSHHYTPERAMLEYREHLDG